jgi:hypothetical protein
LQLQPGAGKAVSAGSNLDRPKRDDNLVLILVLTRHYLTRDLVSVVLICFWAFIVFNFGVNRVRAGRWLRSVDT